MQPDGGDNKIGGQIGNVALGEALKTRLLTTLRGIVTAPQNIGAVPHGTRRTAPLSGGAFDGPRPRGPVGPGSSAGWVFLRGDGRVEMDLRVPLRPAAGP